MHLKVHRRKKDGKEHRYFSVVESHRVSRQRVVHPPVVYLGEINDSRQAAWRKTLEVFDERQQDFVSFRLFPDDREIVADVDTLQVELGEMQLAAGDCAPEVEARRSLSGVWKRKRLRAERTEGVGANLGSGTVGGYGVFAGAVPLWGLRPSIHSTKAGRGGGREVR